MLKSVILKTANVQLPGGAAFDRLTANSLKSFWMCRTLPRSISALLLRQIGVNNELLSQQWPESHGTVLKSNYYTHIYSSSAVC